MPPNAEQARLFDPAPWRRWGPYVADRQWGTVREDYSPNGDAWSYLPFAHAHLRAYRWGEDGLAGVSDDKQQLCLALALWNGVDPILKERLFGLTNGEGNHGEDVKEAYYPLDATPTHSYLRYLYKYPQRAFPYQTLVEENRRRSREDREYELADTGAFAESRYYDVDIEYAKANSGDLFLRVTAHNHGPDPAPLHILPHIWFRNFWSWVPDLIPPELRLEGDRVRVGHPEFVGYAALCDGPGEWLFCDNETNTPVLFNSPGAQYPKDAIGRRVVNGQATAVNPAQVGTKAAAWRPFTVPPTGSVTVRVWLGRNPPSTSDEIWKSFDATVEQRKAEADEYYAHLQRHIPDPDARRVQRQALAGLVWSKQFYCYDVRAWLKGDPAQPPPPPHRRAGRNTDWDHLSAADVICMPDKWEYPWFAAWDSAFHMVAMALIDPDFAKQQLLLFLRHGYLNPNGQLPAYEWNFGDVNPPVHAWACWRVFQIDRKHHTSHPHGPGDRDFLERAFHKLLLNFTWWVNRKDPHGRNVFQGGFLGLDNIGVFDRSQPLPTGGHLNQADATAWVAMYSLNLMRIGLELARENPSYQDIAAKFFRHFLQIADAMTDLGGVGLGLWDEQDQFYYDELVTADEQILPLRVRSLVGLIPLFAVEVLDPDLVRCVPDFVRQVEEELAARPDYAALVSRWHVPGEGESRLLSLLRGHRLKKLLHRMLNSAEFLSDYGVRSLSKFHDREPYRFRLPGNGELTVRYTAGESDSGMFGGNSNWRGPVWLPTNYLIVESLQRFHHYYGDDFRVEHPTGSGQMRSLREIADDLSARLVGAFVRNRDGRRAVFGDDEQAQRDEQFRDYLWFPEYLHGDTGRGLGALHQTGWTALIAKLLMPRG